LTSTNTQRTVNRGEGGENIDKKRWDIPGAVRKSSKKNKNKKNRRVVDPGKYPVECRRDPGVSMEKQARYRRIWHLV